MTLFLICLLSFLIPFSLCRGAEHTIRYFQREALRHYRSRRAHVRWMKRHKAKMAVLDERYRLLTVLLYPSRN